MEADGEGRPVAVTLAAGDCASLQVQDAWRIDDEWWRERPVSRLYFSLVLEDGRVVTVYQDLG